MVLRLGELETTRAQRFADLCRALDAKPARQAREGRWAVLTQSPRWPSFLSRAETREAAEGLAGTALDDGWEPVALFDLDELAGDEPIMIQADYAGHTWMVHGDQHVAGQPTGYVMLKRDHPDRRTQEYLWTSAPPEELSNVEWSDDTRLPVRYNVAGVRKVVAFNTVPGEVT